MNIVMKLIEWVLTCWRGVMDNRYNPLSYIKDPSIQSYFTLALFVMWSCYFGIVAIVGLDWQNYDIVTSIMIHIAVLVPIMITNYVFKEAKDGNIK